MDATEIAKKLRAYIWSAMEVKDNHKDRPEVVKEGNERMDVLNEAVQIVKKQIPMKVNEIHLDEYHCPACGSENNCNNGKIEDKYCPECGQYLQG